ncbi:MAG: BadM/Rrf2 family transcriptional regulator [Zetaproteobacteria bacterium CG_4_9_14_3_um_filter_49_83]|nr:MAG: BadM/Rrf2 family transcriptional regulator [Zetaproteobacteria bacterium CG1_02_49_23]PIQ30888.1 MAG: BadM/Rrf2 family transcriptional regulator [Zetaproteobacteria bacterium CG17_big_fil_post_rev_8_21_14_2_50_50_13]PIY56207.1 MAG: BadM/Rrf2 family transcriptional regulator [Zetaproteobacteria bacterium CG_4_10_14_0_8_um_filter_49_80]PJA34690.1 MAG: BadM/Rrf2 family transcriptional regulator [Zetaproteobacteria bacterium CG_4_9_14_3_um_filter_49_83]
MQLTSYSDYSLRVLLYLALRPEQSVTITEIHQAYGISRNHLVKVVHQLSKLGWITTTRGRSGGIVLAVPPAQINLGTIVLQTEPHMNILECFDADSNTCAISPGCALKRVFYQARKAFVDVLKQYTLADALGHDSQVMIEILDANLFLYQEETLSNNISTAAKTVAN